MCIQNVWHQFSYSGSTGDCSEFDFCLSVERSPEVTFLKSERSTKVPRLCAFKRSVRARGIGCLPNEPCSNSLPSCPLNPPLPRFRHIVADPVHVLLEGSNYFANHCSHVRCDLFDRSRKNIASARYTVRQLFRLASA